VGSPLVRAGYDVKIIDQRVQPQWRQILEEELKRRPVCVGISSSTGPQLRYALEASRLIKQISQVPVVWGGVHPSILPEQTLEEECVDIVVQGEGEETFLELVGALEKQTPLSEIRGLWYKDGSGIRHTPERPFIDLNQQPPLAWPLVELQKYTRTVFGVERLSFTTSRGCPHGCAFCFNTSFNKRRWRRLDSEMAVERLADFVTRYKVKGVFLTDANFFVDLSWARRVLKGIVERNLKIVLTRLHISFESLCRLTGEDLDLLEQAGCACLAVGIESGSPRIRTLLHKEIDNDRLLELNRRLRRRSFILHYFFMIGFPTETKEEIKETVDLFSRLVDENPRASKSVNIYTPYPGTELFDRCVKEGLQAPERAEGWIGFNYRSNLPSSGWQDKKTRQLVAMLDFCSFFVGSRSYRQPFKKTNNWVIFLSRLYAPLARLRVRNLFARLPLEVKLAKLFGLYGKQE
jgi:radical SAM superfamily enzyme YgiQ (UPF0313 family)